MLYQPELSEFTVALRTKTPKLVRTRLGLTEQDRGSFLDVKIKKERRQSQLQGQVFFRYRYQSGKHRLCLPEHSCPSWF